MQATPACPITDTSSSSGDGVLYAVIILQSGTLCLALAEQLGWNSTAASISTHHMHSGAVNLTAALLNLTDRELG